MWCFSLFSLSLSSHLLVKLCFCLWLFSPSACAYPCVSFFFLISFLVSDSICTSLHVSIVLTLSGPLWSQLSVSLSGSVFRYALISTCVSLFVCVSVSFSACVSQYMYMSVCLSVYIFYVSFIVCFFLCVPSLCLFCNMWVSLCMPSSLCVGTCARVLFCLCLIYWLEQTHFIQCPELAQHLGFGINDLKVLTFWPVLHLYFCSCLLWQCLWFLLQDLKLK